MSAYVVVEATVKDPAALERYVEAAGPIVEAFGGEHIIDGPWDVLSGDPFLTFGRIIQFPDKERALAWHNSAEYQDTLNDRNQAMESRFRLLG